MKRLFALMFSVFLLCCAPAMANAPPGDFENGCYLLGDDVQPGVQVCLQSNPYLFENQTVIVIPEFFEVKLFVTLSQIGVVDDAVGVPVEVVSRSGVMPGNNELCYCLVTRYDEPTTTQHYTEIGYSLWN